MFGIVVVAALVHGHLSRSRSSIAIGAESVKQFIARLPDRLQDVARRPMRPRTSIGALPRRGAGRARRRRRAGAAAPAPAAEEVRQ